MVHAHVFRKLSDFAVTQLLYSVSEEVCVFPKISRRTDHLPDVGWRVLQVQFHSFAITFVVLPVGHAGALTASCSTMQNNIHTNYYNIQQLLFNTVNILRATVAKAEF
jgi:hypothetical protein